MAAKAGDALNDVIATVDEATRIIIHHGLQTMTRHNSAGQETWMKQLSNYNQLAIYHMDKQLSEASTKKEHTQDVERETSGWRTNAGVQDTRCI